jgi:quercetin dioxygenase-like cupin family protein
MKQANRRAWRVLALVVPSLLAGGANACAAAAPSLEPDPLHTDGDKYYLLFENQLVRVLRYHDQPGATTHPHHHPCFVLVALSPFERELSFPDGSKRLRAFNAGDAAWMPAQSHAGHNTGNTPTEALIVELKGPCR